LKSTKNSNKPNFLDVQWLESLMKFNHLTGDESQGSKEMGGREEGERHEIVEESKANGKWQRDVGMNVLLLHSGTQ
jgi:hypothetical protein